MNDMVLVKFHPETNIFTLGQKDCCLRDYIVCRMMLNSMKLVLEIDYVL